MVRKTELSPDEVPHVRGDYFEMLAGMGITKHIGSLTATERLVEWCHIGPNSYVLDVGCGVGATPIYLARTHGCRVVGVDLEEKMIARSNQRLKGTGLDEMVEFQVADALELPFEDDIFDAVIAESVLAFIEDRQRALSEWMRVTKAGGYIGFTEATWTKTPPKELDEYMYGTTTGQVEVSETWEELLRSAGLSDIMSGAYEVDMKAEASGRIKRLGLKSTVATIPRMFGVLLKYPGSRSIMSSALSVPKSAFEYVGYGVYAGRNGS
jgi:arsenite methyltransferase